MGPAGWSEALCPTMECRNTYAGMTPNPEPLDVSSVLCISSRLHRISYHVPTSIGTAVVGCHECKFKRTHVRDAVCQWRLTRDNGTHQRSLTIDLPPAGSWAPMTSDLPDNSGQTDWCQRVTARRRRTNSKTTSMPTNSPDQPTGLSGDRGGINCKTAA
jgi:hypothetical protein